MSVRPFGPQREGAQLYGRCSSKNMSDFQCDPKRTRAGVWQPFVNHATSRLQVNKNKFIEQEEWALSFSNVLRQEAQSRLVLKPNPSAFADFLKHGLTYTARSVGAFTGRRYGLLRKRRPQ